MCHLIMTVRLSRHKISKILRYYFSGVLQPVIARRVGVDQSTVSLYASRLKEIATEVGLLAAGEEFNVFEEVGELRSLSVELLKVNLTAEDAREGVKIIRAFNRLGIGPDQHIKLVQVCKKVDDEGFINAALEFMEVENSSNKGYDEIVSNFESITSQLPLVEKKLMALKTEIGSLNNTLTKKKSELAGIQSQLVQFREETVAEKTRLNAELEAEMKRFGVKEQEVKEATKLKSELAKRGLNLSTLIKVVEEFPDDSN